MLWKNNYKYICAYIGFSLVLMSIAIIPVFAYVMESQNYRIQSDSINVGGTDNQVSTPGGYKMADTIGEIATGPSTSSSGYKLKAGYRQMQESYISVSAPETVVMIPVLGAITGGTAEETAIINVKTDNPAGYKLELRASTLPALKLITDEFFSDYTRNTPPDFIWDIGIVNSAFGFTPWGEDVIQRYCYELEVGCDQLGGDSGEDYCWDGFEGSTNIEIASSSSANLSGTDTYVKYRAEIKSNGSQAPGNYTAVITATVTAR